MIEGNLFLGLETAYSLNELYFTMEIAQRIQKTDYAAINVANSI